MKNWKSFTILLFVSALFTAPCAMGQKQDKVDKLLQQLYANDMEKYEKSWEKIDRETASAFKNEIDLITALNHIWNQQAWEDVKNYMTLFVSVEKTTLPSICTNAGISVEQLRGKTEAVIWKQIDSSENRRLLSQQLILWTQSTGYTLPDNMMQKIYSIREEEMLRDIKQAGTTVKCEDYLNEFPKGQYISEVMEHYNRLLFEGIKQRPAHDSFKKYFENKRLNDYYGGLEMRQYHVEVLGLYDDYLFRNVWKAKAPASIRQCINEYEKAPYLQPHQKKHTEELQYRKDSVDFIILKNEVTSGEKLSKVKDYLQTHRYKAFKDQAIALSNSFIESMVMTDGNRKEEYKNGLLVSCQTKGNGKTTLLTYHYDERNNLTGIEEALDEKGRKSFFMTTYAFDSLKLCRTETKSNTRLKKEVYKRIFTQNANGMLLADTTTFANGDLTARRYDTQGHIVEEQNLTKGELVSIVALKYDQAGNLIQRTETFNLPELPLANQVSYQTTRYEYDRFGYLQRTSIEESLVGGIKKQTYIYYLYDEYGNSIQAGYYYEYDHTGRWIKMTNAESGEETGKAECTYRP